MGTRCVSGMWCVIFFGGYEENQLIASPVTGKIIEYGKHSRINYYTLEAEGNKYEIKNTESKTKFDSETIDFIKNLIGLK